MLKQRANLNFDKSIAGFDNDMHCAVAVTGFQSTINNDGFPGCSEQISESVLLSDTLNHYTAARNILHLAQADSFALEFGDDGRSGLCRPAGCWQSKLAEQRHD